MYKKVLKTILFTLIFVSIIWVISAMVLHKKKPHSYKEYLQYLSDKEQGLTKTKYVKGLEITVKYLPAAYLAQKEIQGTITQEEYDKLKAGYSQTKTFQLSIGPDERKQEGGDIMYNGLHEYKEYAERMLTMNFAMEQYITLTTGQSSYKPVLSNLENVYGLQNKRNIQLVFAPQQDPEELNEADYYKITYDDELFGLGVNHFLFDKSDIEEAERLEVRGMNDEVRNQN